MNIKVPCPGCGKDIDATPGLHECPYCKAQVTFTGEDVNKEIEKALGDIDKKDRDIFKKD